MTIPSVTPYSGDLPLRSDPPTFPANAEDYVTWQEGTMTPEINATVAAMNITAAAMTSIAAGGAMSLPYTFSTTTTDADPGAGFVRLSSATQNASTVIRLDLVGADGSTWTDVISTFDDSTSTVKGYVLLQKLTDATKWLEFSVSSLASPAGYKNLTVVPVAGSAASPFADGDSLVLKFTANGDKGDTGAAGANGANGALALIATLTPTAAANLDFLNVFSSTYDNYLIVGSGLTVAADTYALLRLATGGSVDTGSNYWISIGAEAAGNWTSHTSGSASHQFTPTITSAGKGLSFQIDIRNVNDASGLKSIVALIANQTAATPDYKIGTSRCAYPAANTVSGFRLYTNTSTWAATGKVRVYGYSNT